MTLLKKIRILGAIVFALMLSTMTILGFLFVYQYKLNVSHDRRYESYLLANELRMSSDNLTRLARTFVVSGDAKYEKEYWSILDVRNGKSPRPDGRTVSLQKLMQDQGFTDQEFAKLKEAENNSNALVNTETIAMNAIKALAN